MKNMTIENITKACNGKFYGDKSLLDKEITGVEKDSRLIEEGYLYIPFVGNVVDGHKFIPQVFEKGALVTLSEKILETEEYPYIKVESTALALKEIATFYREQLDCKIIGITGSVGKTSTKEIIASVLEQKFDVLKTQGNYNNEIGMPLTILKIRENHDIAVIEMGISDFEEMHRLSAISKPDACVITNIGTCHLENLGDRDGVFKAKTEIFDNLKENAYVVLNGDDDKLSQIKDVRGVKPVFFGIETDRDVCAVKYQSLGIEGTKVTIRYFDEEFETIIPIPGHHMIYNAMAASCFGKHFGMTTEEIDKGIRSLKAISGRNNIFHTDKYVVIDDCYNANPMSMKASLNVLNEANTRKVAILGNMYELGENEKQLHREVGMHAANLGIDVVICIGELAKNIADAAKENNKNIKVFYFETKEEFENKMDDILKENDSILVKASNSMKFKTIVEKLS
ncbi:MAG: UDP-N-acetylmuramoyl-tripeptide--D-alanyl-D-alanine ligase [Eubacterium sp.]|jgi:UDP-N-acetylmuramoyl-tripeptide--D-alanyl-D-alanine ligase|uniref:UDP-N-acetylmuramoyl-tripeptide--D-alanyl-D- alanine ligase n=1 Tax=Eubacterium sp. TaxID=142586 RepID=UPI00300F02AE